MSSQCKECGDIEAGEYEIFEGPKQVTFICKVYLIVSIQLLFTFMVAFDFLASMYPLAFFILTTEAGFIIFFIICVITLTAFCLLYFCRFANFLLLFICTTALALLVGLTCAPASGKVIAESMMFTTAVIVNLTLYSFWGASRGHDFDFFLPFLFASVVLVMLFVSIQIIFPLDKLFVKIYGLFGSIRFCSHIVYVTDSLIIRNRSYKKCIQAAACLYIEFINMFLLFFTVFRALDD